MKRLSKSTKMRGAIFAFLLAFAVSVSAQVQVQGTVVDERGDPAIGAAVRIQGTTQGTVTDVNGRFTLSAPAGGTLEISFIGYATQYVPVSATVNVRLVPDAELLQELIIQVPYGTIRRASFTGSAGIVGADAIRDRPAMNFETALQGVAPGISIQRASGQPGSQQEIVLRGHGSVNASIQPLYVIDGVPIAPENLSTSGVTGQQGTIGISSLIATSDIYSITILRDAAATAMFGSRGGNGVIMITTRSGREGRTNVRLRSTVGFSNWAVDNRPNLTGDQIRTLWHEGRYNFNIDRGMTSAAAMTEANEFTDARFVMPTGGWSDWESVLFRNRGSIQTYEASVSGGTAATRFFVSLSHTNELGMAANSSAQQYTGRLNLDHEWGRMRMGANMSISNMSRNRVMEGTSFSNPYFRVRFNLRPDVPIFNADGSYYQGPLLGGLDNLAETQFLDQNFVSIFNVRSTVWGELSILDNLRLRQTLSYDITNTNSTVIWPSNSPNGEMHGGLMIRRNPMHERIYSSTVLSFDHSIGQHNFDALIGWDAEKITPRELRATGAGFGSPNILVLAGAAEPRSAWSIIDYDRMLSALSRVNYNFANRYYLSASWRRDGSSRFGAHNRWGTFWSLSGAWRVTGEEFMAGTADVLRDLRIRASIGDTGNLPANLYESQATFGVFGNYRGQPVSWISRIANPDLTWEKVRSWNIGLDANLWSRLFIEFDFYQRNTSNLISEMPVSQTTGFENFVANTGSLRNQGFELGIGYNVIDTRDFRWFTRLNVARNVNTVTEVYGGHEEIIRGNFITREGYSFWTFFHREFAGINPYTGHEQWVRNNRVYDAQGNFSHLNRELTENPAEAQRVVLGNADPTWTGGWVNTLTYRGFELSALFTFTQGGHFWDLGWSRSTLGQGDFTNWLPMREEYYNRWRGPGDTQATVGRRVTGYTFGNFGSSKWMYSSDHIRLKNLTLAYNLPRNLVQRASLTNVRLTATGTNLFTFARTPGFDPEIPTGFQVSFEFPPLREFVFGVEVSF